MSPDQLAGLADDLAANDLTFFIETRSTDKGVFIIDGRNRLDAFELKGIKLVNDKGEWLHPEFIHYGGPRTDAEILGEVISLNLHRRHLTTSQRAMVAAKLANMPHGGDRRSQSFKRSLEMRESQAADMLKISESSVQRAKEVLEKAPEQVPAIESGEKTVGEAASELKPETPPDELQPKPRHAWTLADIRAYRAHARRHMKEVPDFARMLLEACDEVERLRMIADERNGVFSDFTLMPFGKRYRGWKLGDIPDDHFEWWLRQPQNDLGAIQSEAQFSEYPERAIAQQKLKFYDYAIRRVGEPNRKKL